MWLFLILWDFLRKLIKCISDLSVQGMEKGIIYLFTLLGSEWATVGFPCCSIRESQGVK